MFKTQNYRDKAAQQRKRADDTDTPGEMHEFRTMERRFNSLASKEERLADNFDQTIQVRADTIRVPADAPIVDDATLAEEHMLRCLGAAVIMQWSTIPAKLQRELFDNAGSMGDLLRTTELRGQLARFLHNRKDD